MNTDLRPKTIFITGTDTGVGKTVLTALLLSHLRQTGVHALAIKPFCSGGRADAELLYDLQGGDLTLDEINPFHFPEPLAPLVAARKHKRRISLKSVLTHIQTVAKRSLLNDPSIHITPVLLIEGAGGLLAPLGEHFTLLDLLDAFIRPSSKSTIRHPASRIHVIVVAPNRLGTINHTLLTVRALHAPKQPRISVVLTDIDGLFSLRNTDDVPRSPSRVTRQFSEALLAKEDQPLLSATHTNPSVLAELLSPTPLFRLPNLGKNPGKSEQIQQFAKKYKKTLAEIFARR